ncbi:MAG: DNA mismatch repair protein MutS, partial [Candidatus Enterenecus sp.]
MAEMTPMMRQYLSVKAQHPDCLLFFRLGDFYEMFLEDAKVGAEELGLTLTTRDRGKPEEERTPMCGVPYHSAQSYIARLIKRGYKVAICEQMEDPALAKGLVDRDVIRIVTPGTAMDDVMLDESRNNYICAVYKDSAGAALARCDMSTGQFVVVPYTGSDWLPHMLNQLSACPPSEAILSDAAASETELTDFLRDRLGCLCEAGGEARFRPEPALSALAGCGLRPAEEPAPADTAALLCCQAAGGLASYLAETQKTDLSHLGPLVMEEGTEERHMELDLTARQTLELTETLRNKEKKGSLLWVLDRTRTPMGHRLIRAWLEQPLCSVSAIRRRQDAVAVLADNTVAREELILTLKQVPDLERLIAKVVYGSANARDMKLLSQGLGQLPTLSAQAAGLSGRALSALLRELEGLEDLRQAIDDAIRDEDDDHRLPFTIREGDFIRPGYDAEVDHLRDVLEHGADMVMAIEGREKERTGIKSLKVRYNKVFGYYIEVSKSNYDLVPDDYIRKQTLVNCERFITQELKDLEHEILSAQTRITALEYQLFCRLRDTVAARVRQVQSAAASVARLDVLCSFAAVAVQNGYCRPEVDESGVIQIREGRHPVVERMLKDTLFVPNDTDMDGEGERLAIITGPNMAGKSTYMRQVALIVLMAQMGSFVPARSARIGLVDRVFTRIGASDDLGAGQSTFMVEMAEVAQMLKNATKHSLLILDEIGRGTSTYDGM